MRSPYVCLACRRRIGRIRPPKVLQWQARATFVSLASQAPPAGSDQQLKDDLLELGGRSDKRKAGLGAASIAQRTPRPPPPIRNPGDELESLFDNIRTSPPPTINVSPEPAGPLDLYKKVDTLSNMLHGSYTLRDSWGYFIKHFGSGSATKSSINHKLPPYVSKVSLELLGMIVRAKKKDPLSQTLPSTTEVSRVYLQLSILSGPQWSEMVVLLIETILNIRQGSAPDRGCEERLTSDLLGAWNVICRSLENFQYFPPIATPSLNWSYLPAISSQDALAYYERRHRHYFFGLLTPAFPSRHFVDVPVLAIATFGLLACTPAYGEVVAEASPFLGLLSRLIATPGLDTSSWFHSTTVAANAVTEYVRRDWVSIRDKAREMSSNRSPQTEIKHAVGKEKAKSKKTVGRDAQPTTDSHTKSGRLVTKLHNALARRNLYQAECLWADAIHWPVVSGNVSKEPVSRKTGTLSEDECNLFIMAFMGLRAPDRAIEVWNHMIRSGISPGVNAWDSMLCGCKSSRDVKSLEEVWVKMKMMRVTPDIFCWTTRINALISLNEIEAGIRALDEMGRIWIAAVKEKYPKSSPDERLQFGDIDDAATKPTIEVVNGAIAALLQRGRNETAYHVLAWAGRFGIKPDIITYNTLLRPLCRHGYSEEALALLQQMQSAGIQADVATFTTILEETFRDAGELSPDEQKELVSHTFQEMEASGIQPNLHTYGKIIYELLKTSNGDMTAPSAIMEHMAKHGLEPGPHIYTILMNYYFDQSPPDLETVRQIVQRAEMSVKWSDHRFWDRCIEGYARAGQTAAALKILGKMKIERNKVGWVSLHALLLALAQHGEWELARTLVMNTIADTGGPIPSHTHGEARQHQFWALVQELGLLEND